MATATATRSLTVRTRTLGRTRCGVSNLYKNAPLARQPEQQLGRIAGVSGMVADPTTGSLLVHSAQALPASAWESTPVQLLDWHATPAPLQSALSMHGLRRLLGLTPMGWRDWATVLAGARGPFLVNELIQRSRRVDLGASHASAR